MMPLNNLDIEQLQRNAMAKDAELQEVTSEFMEAHMWIVESVSKNLLQTKVPPGVGIDDLISWGTEGLIKAKRSFDSAKNTQFTTYAYYRVRGEIMDQLRREWAYRNPSDYRHQQEKIQRRIVEVTQDMLEHNDDSRDADRQIADLIASSEMVYLLSLDEAASGSSLQDDGIAIEDEVERLQNVGLLWSEVRELSSEEQQIIEMFYIYNISQKEISDRLKLSKSKVCRIHLKALDKLKRRLLRRYDS